MSLASLYVSGAAEEYNKDDCLSGTTYRDRNLLFFFGSLFKNWEHLAATGKKRQQIDITARNLTALLYQLY